MHWTGTRRVESGGKTTEVPSVGPAGGVVDGSKKHTTRVVHDDRGWKRVGGTRKTQIKKSKKSRVEGKKRSRFRRVWCDRFHHLSRDSKSHVNDSKH